MTILRYSSSLAVDADTKTVYVRNVLDEKLSISIDKMLEAGRIAYTNGKGQVCLSSAQLEWLKGINRELS